MSCFERGTGVLLLMESICCAVVCLLVIEYNSCKVIVFSFSVNMIVVKRLTCLNYKLYTLSKGYFENEYSIVLNEGSLNTIVSYCFKPNNNMFISGAFLNHVARVVEVDLTHFKLFKTITVHNKLNVCVCGCVWVCTCGCLL